MHFFFLKEQFNTNEFLMKSINWSFKNIYKTIRFIAVYRVKNDRLDAIDCFSAEFHFHINFTQYKMILSL